MPSTRDRNFAIRILSTIAVLIAAAAVGPGRFTIALLTAVGIEIAITLHEFVQATPARVPVGRSTAQGSMR